MSDQNNNNKEIPSTLNLTAKRDQYTKEIRKQKRDEILNTNRDRIEENGNPMEGEEVDHENAKEEENSTLDKLVEEWKNQTFSQTDFEDLINAARSEDKLSQLYGFVGLTKLGENPANLEKTIQSIIDCNIPDVLIKALTMHNEPHLQREATKLIGTITSGNDNQTKVLLDKGVLPYLFQLLKSESKKTLEYVFIAIGKFASNPQHRDLILKTGGLNPVLEAVNKVTSPEYLSRFRSIKIMETNIIPKLIQHMDHKELRVSTPCLRIIGMFWTLPENDMRSYSSEFVPKLLKLLRSSKRSIRREVCWLLSNITAGTSSDVNLLFDHPYFTDMIIRIVKTDISEIVREAVWVLANAMKNLDKNKVSEVIEWGFLDCFIYVLDNPEPKTAVLALHGINSILTLGNLLVVENGHSNNEALELLENKGGVKKIQNLQTHENDEVNKLAYNIRGAFFELECLIWIVCMSLKKCFINDYIKLNQY